MFGGDFIGAGIGVYSCRGGIVEGNGIRAVLIYASSNR